MALAGEAISMGDDGTERDFGAVKGQLVPPSPVDRWLNHPENGFSLFLRIMDFFEDGSDPSSGRSSAACRTIRVRRGPEN